MVDTIIIRIHNLDKYPQLYEQYYSPSKKKISQTMAYVDDGVMEAVTTFKSPAVIYHDTNRVIPITHRSTYNISSSHYSISTFISAQNFLEFNLSIPKYLYANNVMQFINMSDQGSRIMYLELMNFIRNFIKDMCLLQEPLDEDVEINRIDMCYNQIFNCKDDAIQYLEAQQVINRKMAKASKNKGRSYDGESLSYVTRRYSFKVYHKGAEFKKNDAQKIASNNKKNLPISHLQELADRTLRYEMTFRTSMFTYLMKHYFFVSESSAVYGKHYHHPVVTFAQRLIKTYGYAAYEKFNRFAKKFTLLSPFDYSKDLDFLTLSPVLTFDESIFTMCYDTFWEKVNQYQMDKTFNYSTISTMIDEHNANNQLKNKLRRSPDFGKSKSRLLIAAILAQKMDLEQLRSLIPKRTFQTLKSDLKTIGIGSADSNLNFPKPRTDYWDYRIYFNQLHNSI